MKDKPWPCIFSDNQNFIKLESCSLLQIFLQTSGRINLLFPVLGAELY